MEPLEGLADWKVDEFNACTLPLSIADSTTGKLINVLKMHNKMEKTAKEEINLLDERELQLNKSDVNIMSESDVELAQRMSMLDEEYAKRMSELQAEFAKRHSDLQGEFAQRKDPRISEMTSISTEKLMWKQHIEKLVHHRQLVQTGLDYVLDYTMKWKVERDQKLNDALGELEAGEKTSCWMWYVFPVEEWESPHSKNTEKFLIKDMPRFLWDDEARGDYMRACYAVEIGLEKNPDVELMFGKIDAAKLRSSLASFEYHSREYHEDVHIVCMSLMRKLEACEMKTKGLSYEWALDHWLRQDYTFHVDVV